MPVTVRTLADYESFALRAFRKGCDRSIEWDQPPLIAPLRSRGAARPDPTAAAMPA